MFFFKHLLKLARKGFFAVFLFLFGFSIRLSAQIDEEQEMIFHLFQFIDWDHAVLSNKELFLIGVFNNQNITNEMKQYFADKMCYGKKIKVVNFLDLKKNNNYDLIYLPESEVDKTHEIITFCNEYKILSVSTNNSEFCKNGGIVNFEYARMKCNIQINNKIALDYHVYFSPQLLNIAELID